MKNKIQKIAIDPVSPFSNDKVSREKSAQLLTHYVSSIKQPYVLAIDGKWGTGKSTFIEMWLPVLSQQKITTVLFNAWEADYHDDVLAPLIFEFTESVKKSMLSEATPENEAINKILKKTKTFGIKLAKRILPAVVKAGSAGLIDLAEITADGLDEAAEKASEEFLKAYEQKKNSVTGFKDALGECVKAVRTANGDLPFVYIIDELDRCRPSYALELLEKIKHLFNVEGVVFVLAVDLDQLSNTLKGIYGEQFDARGYLRRFIDMEYRLPPPNLKDFSLHTLKALDLEEMLRTICGDVNAPRFVSEIFGALAALFSMSLRDIEQALAQLNVFLRTFPNSSSKYDYLLLPLVIALRFARPELYDRLMNTSLAADELITIIAAHPEGTAMLKTHNGAYFEGALYREISNEKEVDYRIEQAEIVSQSDSENEATAAAQRLIDVLRSYPLEGRRNLKDLHARLEMTKDFAAL